MSLGECLPEGAIKVLPTPSPDELAVREHIGAGVQPGVAGGRWVIRGTRATVRLGRVTFADPDDPRVVSGEKEIVAVTEGPERYANGDPVIRGFYGVIGERLRKEQDSQRPLAPQVELTVAAIQQAARAPRRRHVTRTPRGPVSWEEPTLFPQEELADAEPASPTVATPPPAVVPTLPLTYASPGDHHGSQQGADAGSEPLFAPATKQPSTETPVPTEPDAEPGLQSSRTARCPACHRRRTGLWTPVIDRAGSWAEVCDRCARRPRRSLYISDRTFTDVLAGHPLSCRVLAYLGFDYGSCD